MLRGDSRKIRIPLLSQGPTKERATGDSDEQLEDPAGLLPVHWILRGQHLPIEEARAWDRFQLGLRISLRCAPGHQDRLDHSLPVSKV